MLRKSIQTKIGIPAEYWRIEHIEIDRNAKRCEISLSGYHDPNYAPIDGIKIAVADIVYPEEYNQRDEYDYTNNFSPEALEGEDLYQVAYTYIKEHIPEFEGSEDC